MNNLPAGYKVIASWGHPRPLSSAPRIHHVADLLFMVDPLMTRWGCETMGLSPPKGGVKGNRHCRDESPLSFWQMSFCHKERLVVNTRLKELMIDYVFNYYSISSFISSFIAHPSLSVCCSSVAPSVAVGNNAGKKNPRQFNSERSEVSMLTIIIIKRIIHLLYPYRYRVFVF